ncbi:Homeodomain-like domain-containing protein [Krasilnikovia cinnamomea]|uniref:Homeodomain-like domain-containing protein n=1 Tax=Krasilnikovia cinnamomea TaxID=349313 RepID=A0A4Q7Z7R2_9ACTN|nr:helix-turn-helix domain-containing protein [Krasilnikovia cinnamomea]RZU46527.1 Homeodomain-like domain-containing protein [Krasilnikovia cinnamomea]
MHNPNFVIGRERQLRNLINHLGKNDIAIAACVGVDPDIYHPEQGLPNELALARCAGCPARLACLALALRTEDPEARAGWYGGLGPADRDNVAAHLRLDTPEPPPPDRALEAARLRTAGWTVNTIATHLGCSRRTVQRYLRAAA